MWSLGQYQSSRIESCIELLITRLLFFIKVKAFDIFPRRTTAWGLPLSLDGRMATVEGVFGYARREALVVGDDAASSWSLPQFPLLHTLISVGIILLLACSETNPGRFLHQHSSPSILEYHSITS